MAHDVNEESFDIFLDTRLDRNPDKGSLNPDRDPEQHRNVNDYRSTIRGFVNPRVRSSSHNPNPSLRPNPRPIYMTYVHDRRINEPSD